METLIKASMVIFKTNAKAAPTIVAMEKSLLRTNSTDATLLTVKDSFIMALIVIERAYHAEILCEVLVALDASFRLGLLSPTSKTLDMGDFMSVQLMVLFRVHFVFKMDFIVTKSTCIKCSFTNRIRALQLTCSKVVFTTMIARF